MKLKKFAQAGILSISIISTAYANHEMVAEIEIATGDDHEGVHSHDVALATVELGFHFAAFNHGVRGSFVALHEDGSAKDWETDQAFFTVGNTEEYPLYLSAGRMYLPFGYFETHLISDPLTLEIGETRETAIQFGFAKHGWYGSAYAFNGDLEERGDDGIGNYGFNLGYAVDNENHSFDAGFSWINHVGDSDGIEGAVADTDADGAPGPVKDIISAYGLHGVYRTGPWSLMAEYISAAERFRVTELAWKTRGVKPNAFNLEAGYDFEAFASRECHVALSFQGTGESVVLGLPERKLLAGFSTTLHENASLSFEFSRAVDYSMNDGGTGKKGHAVVLQVAVEF